MHGLLSYLTMEGENTNVLLHLSGVLTAGVRPGGMRHSSEGIDGATTPARCPWNKTIQTVSHRHERYEVQMMGPTLGLDEARKRDCLREE